MLHKALGLALALGSLGNFQVLEEERPTNASANQIGDASDDPNPTASSISKLELWLTVVGRPSRHNLPVLNVSTALSLRTLSS